MSVTAWLRATGKTTRHLAALGQTRAPIVFLNQRWQHHGRHSGYLVDEGLGPWVPRTDRLFPEPVKRWQSARAGAQADDFWELRWLTWLSLAAARADLLHVIDGDFDGWAYARRSPLSRVLLTATFHQPVDVLGGIASRVAPGALDGIVCVSRDQIPLLAPLVAPGRCVFIPHGVDAAFFCPAAPTDEAPGDRAAAAPSTVLVVGSHRRDFETLLGTARQVKAHRPEVTFRLVGPADKLAPWRGRAEGVVELRSGLSDLELRAEYRAAALVYLPLEHATANNALLEGMACARPVVLTDLPALHDYANDDAVVFCAARQPEDNAAAILRVLADPVAGAAMGRRGRERALRLDWPLVRAEVRAFFDAVIGAGPPSADSATRG